MSDLAEFLLARVAEDEAEAHAGAEDDKFDCSDRASVPRGAWSQERVLAECAALRWVAEDWLNGARRLDDRGRPAHLFDPALSMLLKSHEGWLRVLAAPHASHPDYDEEWAP